MIDSSMKTSPAQWTVAELESDGSWVYELDDAGRRDLVAGVRKMHDPAKTLLDYRREDFDAGSAQPIVDAAFNEAKHGRGLAILRGLPREGVTEKEFELLTWGIGLGQGVGRPQGKASQYISAVRDVGVDYRSTTGRGYSSKAELDFHTDSADVVVLSCYNKAISGGMSMVSSSVTAYALMVERYPDLLPFLHRPVHFSRQGELRPGEQPSYPHPIFDEADGQMSVRWNRNRVMSAQKLEGVPRISEEHWDALNKFDNLLRDPEVEYTMYMKPGDAQLLNSHTTLHARTDYVDHDDPAMKRLMFRLWIAPPDSRRLPESWRVAYKAVAPGSVRGGILGDNYDERCRAFDREQAERFGMSYDAAAHQ